MQKNKMQTQKIDSNIEKILSKEKNIKSGQWEIIKELLWIKKSLGIPIRSNDQRYFPFTSWEDFNGSLINDGSKTCNDCKSHNLFCGNYTNEHETSMYAEVVGDDSRPYKTNESFNICLDCLDFKVSNAELEDEKFFWYDKNKLKLPPIFDQFFAHIIKEKWEEETKAGTLGEVFNTYCDRKVPKEHTKYITSKTGDLMQARTNGKVICHRCKSNYNLKK
jgi:hypothetical protein